MGWPIAAALFKAFNGFSRCWELPLGKSLSEGEADEAEESGTLRGTGSLLVTGMSLGSGGTVAACVFVSVGSCER